MVGEQQSQRVDMTESARWIATYILMGLMVLAVVAWVISFAIRSALDHRERKQSAGQPRIRAKSLTYRE